MELFNDICEFVEMLSVVDIVFFTAIVVLLILLVTLVYFIKINRDVLDNDDYIPPMPPSGGSKDNDKDDNLVKLEEVKEDNNKDIEEEYNDEEAPLIDLETLTKKLQSESNESDRITCTEYEKDQEQKAIISYDELVKRHNNYAINYEKEEVKDDVVIKKVNLNDLINKEEVTNIKDVRVISYNQEEAFLNALKELNHLLN